MSRSYQLHPSPASASGIDFSKALNEQQLNAVTPLPARIS